ncbi:MAG: competence/damage-inducible protein A [candidate division Zixibacteria bacterium]|nr:competence/damage-inducible protein A [candidate division Zixibacteria bacterium]
MNVEIITVGDELLLGYTVDTNSSYIARQLGAAGFTVRYKTSVGDSLDAMEEAFQLALKRSHIVIVTGGLGPTDDDLTKRAIVKVFKRNLIFHEEILEDLRIRFAKRGLEMPAINQNQALLPQAAEFFPNKYGSAVGICIAEHGRVFISLPGVPLEMQQILDDEVVPYLERLKLNSSIHVATLRTTGIFESALAEKIKPGLRLEPGVRLAYLPGFSGVDLRVMASAADPEEGAQKAGKLVDYLERTVGKYIYGRDSETLEAIIGQLLGDNDKTLGVAESCTAGQLGMIITSVPGSSRYFFGGVLAYANDVKVNQLGVSPELLNEQGAVSEECAVAMAQGCRSLLGTDYALSITGIAGPEGGSNEKPVGTSYIGLASAHAARARLFNFGTERHAIRARASYAALEMLRREILDIK